MLHQDAKFAAGEKSADFHLTRPGGGAEVSLEGVSSQQKAKPAMLELGALANTPGQASPSKLVHYSQFQAGATPQAASGTPASRNVTEITSAPAKPTPMNVGPTTSITPPKINPLSPKPSISAAIPIPQPPKPSSGMSQSPSGTPQPPKPPVVQKNYP